MTVKNWQPPTAEEIKKLREQTGFTQAKTAHLCRIGLPTYQKWEQGTTNPSQSAWSIYMYELKAIGLGYPSLDVLINTLEDQN